MKAVLPGSDIIIISIDAARVLLSAFRLDSKNEVARLKKLGALEVLDELRQAVREYDASRRNE